MSRTDYSQEVGAHETRKLKARREALKSVWFGFGMFGMVGWSVAVPTVLGALLGIKLDQRYPSPHSWTLSLIIVGLVIGILNAWHWVSTESNGPSA